MEAQTRSAAAQPRPRVPVLAWALAAVALIGVGWGIASLIRKDDQIKVAVTKSALPPYHQIVSTDLELREVSDDNLPALAARQLVGRVTRTSIPAGQPIKDSSVTGVINADLLKGVTVELDPSKSASGDLVPGEPVVLRLAPTSDDAAVHASSVPALLLNTGKDDGPPFTVVVAADQAGPLLELIGRAELFVTPAA